MGNKASEGPQSLWGVGLFLVARETLNQRMRIPGRSGVGCGGMCVVSMITGMQLEEVLNMVRGGLWCSGPLLFSRVGLVKHSMGLNCAHHHCGQ